MTRPPTAAPEPADSLLREILGAEPVPSLSAGFDVRLARRLREEGGRQALPWSSRLLLGAYWAVAGALSLWVVARTPLPAELPWPVALPFLLATLGLLVPALILWRGRAGESPAAGPRLPAIRR